MTCADPDGPAGRVVAHRAGNDPAAAVAALAAGADAVEADVYVFRGRVELRHARTLGPWWSRRFEVDGWRPRLVPAARPRPVLADLLAAIDPDALVMLDIKGAGRGGGPAPTPGRPPLAARFAAGVGARVAAAWAAIAPDRPVIVSAQAWPALGAFLLSAPASDGRARTRPGATVVLSAGTPRQAAAVARRADGIDGAAIGLPFALLSAQRAAQMRRVAPRLFAWGLRSADEVQLARRWGVTDVIVDDLRIARRTR